MKPLSENAKRVLFEVAKRGEQLDSLAVVVEHFIRMNKGASGLAKMLSIEYHEAKPGSLLRQRILDMVLRTWRYVDENSGAIMDVDSMELEDLERLLAERLELAGRNDHQTQEPNAAAGGNDPGASAASERTRPGQGAAAKHAAGGAPDAAASAPKA